MDQTLDIGVRKRTVGEAFRAFFTYQPSQKIKAQDVILFCRQLSSFVRVGIPVTTAIRTFGEQATTSALQKIYADVVTDLDRGARLSDAFGRHPKAFPPILVDMVRSAEASGNLDQVLRQAAKHIERERSARQKIRSAMTYPVIIAVVAFVVAIGIVVFVLPQFRTLYASLNVKTPGIMAALLGFSSFISDHALILAAGVLAAVVALGVWLRTDQGRYKRDAIILKVPFIAAMTKASATERFCRTLGDMLAAGVPISQTYGVVVANVRNRVFRKALADVAPALAAGRGIYRPLQETGVFAPSVVQMIRVGEETGHLDSNLVECADMFEEELDFRIKKMTSVLEPALIVFVGMIVGFVAITMVTSIYSLAGGFK
jgi:type IV pilus assembly protein PilC